ncbi:MAG TPA: ChrR family anti-sigma-E factor [Alphaproteobacteria bacterium]|nr:ChrR family anti-sigma-E factor [Alphaproteobacteria bacterium]
MIDHSLVEMMLMHYAAGHLRPTEALLVACHVALNPLARRKLEAFEAMGAKMICECPEEDAAPVSKDCFEKVMARIESPAPPAPAHIPMQQDAAIPPAVMKLLCGNCTERSIRWQKLPSGVEAVSLHVPAGSPCRHRLRLLRLSPHQQTPAHSHAGREVTLVLQGGFSDHAGSYRAGDLIVIDDKAFVHAPRAGADGCLCLMLTDAPLLFRRVRIWFFGFFKRV